MANFGVPTPDYSAPNWSWLAGLPKEYYQGQLNNRDTTQFNQAQQHAGMLGQSYSPPPPPMNPGPMSQGAPANALSSILMGLRSQPAQPGQPAMPSQPQPFQGNGNYLSGLMSFMR